ncbi:DUF2799 domain-containing protein [Motilimonas sp. E26]|uniref:DUF2799 domain-containing protein n=1 Tax=Motilimonas sp. E26 TaxID=2865674 RepID=UPI001E34D5BD|nr:DUF2799 domain-containing protein [Motilimonas sp. E26]MCE0557322.1 DUF2799 domain-containing protein [Motilimonas sp. E26]
MKSLLIVLVLALQVGCASYDTMEQQPEMNNPQAWHAYGEEHANKGFIQHSKQGLAKKWGVSINTLNDQAFNAYNKGYMIGKKQYCSQNATWLGATGQIYRGICDDIDPFYRQDYMNGLRSHLGRM